MKVSTILDNVDMSKMALPEFQRGYVWNRNQVRGLVQSLYRRYPVGSLLVWTTETQQASTRGGGPTAGGVVNLLLDGQQRITSLYGIMRGHPPTFFQGAAGAFTDLRFDVRTETFEFYGPVKMKDDPLWVVLWFVLAWLVDDLTDATPCLVGGPGDGGIDGSSDFRLNCRSRGWVRRSGEDGVRVRTPPPSYVSGCSTVGAKAERRARQQGSQGPSLSRSGGCRIWCRWGC